ncbi:V-type ATPase 116kDa subunit family protein [Maritimibacter sp. HL-12]|uniref:V-type ATPase 116kDa subunit family protein n=1 Tax=Maritimibacter sp. HL-12 TaxID=1162418 RepID=UPI000A0EFD36|nr:V-type ATPase 116kDa subunit family protein [Maritimibacter sp. HL-12]SMH54122.1 V/A-type H+-transporting ATPase subunit I [Maritimibacter sp. HL-12]
MLRPRPTTWFELLTSRQHFALAMQVLAASGAAQLEARPLAGSEPVLPRLEEFFAAFHALEADYGGYWPEARGHAGLALENPIAVLEETLARLESWAQAADRIIADIRACEARLGELALIGELVEAVPGHLPLARLGAGGGRLVDHAIFFLPAPVPDLPDIGAAFSELFPTDRGGFLVVLAERHAMAGLAERLASLRATPVPLPEFLRDDPAGHAAQVRVHSAAVAETCSVHRERLDELAEETGLAGLLNRVAVLEWLAANAGDITASRHVMRITGWTRDPGGAEIRAALDAAEVDYALTLGEGAPGDPPMVLENPGFLKAFEFFPRLLGVPADREVDPSIVTALIAPVLFGFMFGDVGQGAVLVLVGLLLHRRIPLLFLLIPGGIMAMVFGVLFGSVFSMEGIIPALWLHPLDEPITVLAAALAIGAGLLALAIALDMVQAAWRGQLMRWMAGFGGVTLAWAGLLAAFAFPALAWGLPLGLALTLAGARSAEGWSPAAAGKAAAEFVETLMRLLVSTVSFARVGAFALAHGGLSAAVVGVADALGGAGFWIALLLGNLLILTLEALVTGIQTTRLILFEFFIRFFHAEGREFRPLSAPGQHLREGTPS